MAVDARSVWVEVWYRRPFAGAPSVTTLSFRRPPSVTTFNFSVPTLSCTPSLPYVATLFFNLPSLHPPYLGRHQNGSQQRTVTRTRRLSQKGEEERMSKQPANTINDSINKSIKLRPPREVPKTTTVRMYSQRTTIENDSNQSEPSIPPPN